MIESWFGNYKKGSGPDGPGVALIMVRAAQNFIGYTDPDIIMKISNKITDKKSHRRTNESAP